MLLSSDSEDIGAIEVTYLYVYIYQLRLLKTKNKNEEWQQDDWVKCLVYVQTKISIKRNSNS